MPKTLRDYLDKILKKPFMNSKGRVYYIKSVNHEVMNVIYENGEEDFFAMFQHYNDKRAYWWQTLSRPKCTRIFKNAISHVEIEDCPTFETGTDYIDEHSCCPAQTSTKCIESVIVRRIDAMEPGYSEPDD